MCFITSPAIVPSPLVGEGGETPDLSGGAPGEGAGDRPSDMTLRCRNAGSVRVCSIRPSPRGDGAPKSANLWLRIRCRTRRPPFGAPEADDYSAPGRAFAVCAPRPAELSTRGDGRVWDRPYGRQPAPWQGPVVGTGGAPTPPGWLVKRTSPTGAALRPANARFATAPLKRTRWMQDNGGLEGGDKFQSDKPRRLSVFRGRTFASGDFRSVQKRISGRVRNGFPDRTGLNYTSRGS